MHRQHSIKSNKELTFGPTVSLSTLIQLRHPMLPPIIQKAKHRSLSAGEKTTNQRGRGIEFDVTREYQSGDDIRNMAWRVTARSLKPHIKVYREEKETPIWLALDLSPSLFFGTRCMFKSVKIIQQATIMGWACLQKRERIAAMIATSEKPQIFYPHASEKHFLTILSAFAASSELSTSFQHKDNLQHLLLHLQQQVRAGHIIHLYSDFMNFDADIQKRLTYLAQRALVILHFIYDPFEAIAPPPFQYLITNDDKNKFFNMRDNENRQHYQQQFHDHIQKISHFSRKNGLVLHLHCTDETKKVSL